MTEAAGEQGRLAASVADKPARRASGTTGDGDATGARGRTDARGTTRARMVDSAAVLLRERGVAGVTVDAVLAHSDAPRGSVYHHFPGGRDEIVLAALDRAGDFISAKLTRASAEGDPQRAVRSFVRFWERALVESDFRAGCPAVAVVVDGRREIPGATDAVRSIFDRWHREMTALLTGAGHSPARAARLATLIVAAIEGAIVLCRASGDVQPLVDVAAELDLLLDAR